MYKTMIICQENRERVAKLLGYRAPWLVPEHMIQRDTWILWTTEDPSDAFHLPHRVFKDTFNVIAHEEENLVCERINK